MATEVKNEGTLWVQDRSKHPHAPGYTGVIVIEGEKFYLSAWVNTIKDGPKAGQQIIRLRAERPKEKSENAARSTDQGKLPMEQEPRQLTKDEERLYQF